MSDQVVPTTGRRLTRGHVELRGRWWINRFRVEVIDAATGVISTQQARMRLGTARQIRSLARAEAVLDSYIALQAPERVTPGPSITAGEFFARFDRFRITLMRRESARGYRSVIRCHLGPTFGHLPLGALDTQAVQRMVVALHARGLARASIEAIRNKLLQILAAARADGFATHTIRRADIKLPAEARAERAQRHVTDEELVRILEASTGEPKALFAILGFAGMRIGEALGLEWHHVDLGAGTLRIRQAATCGQLSALKTFTARRDVPLLPPLRRILRDYRAQQGEPTGLLFRTRTGKPRRADDVRRRWLKPLLKHLEMPAATPHSFRHGLPGKLDALGLSPASIQKWMGHGTLAMTERYLHRSTEDLREQLAAALRRKSTDQASHEAPRET